MPKFLDVPTWYDENGKLRTGFGFLGNVHKLCYITRKELSHTESPSDCTLMMINSGALFSIALAGKANELLSYWESQKNEFYMCSCIFICPATVGATSSYNVTIPCGIKLEASATYQAFSFAANYTNELRGTFTVFNFFEAT